MLKMSLLLAAMVDCEFCIDELYVEAHYCGEHFPFGVGTVACVENAIGPGLLRKNYTCRLNWVVGASFRSRFYPSSLGFKSRHP